MFVLTQDKKTLMDVAVVKAERNFGGRGDAKYALTGTACADVGATILGFFATEDEAIAELQRMMAAIEAGRQTYTISD